LGSLAVFLLVSFFFIPDILAQNDFLRAPPSGWGRFRPGLPGLAALYEARPLAFKPPFGFFPSARCHAGVFAMCHPQKIVTPPTLEVVTTQKSFTVFFVVKMPSGGTKAKPVRVAEGVVKPKITVLEI
jgi:hypothetical protein